MKFEDIKKGKKYYKKQTKTDSRRKISKVTGIAVLVLDTNETNVQVLASLGGTPAQWFSIYSYQKWVANDPTK